MSKPNKGLEKIATAYKKFIKVASDFVTVVDFIKIVQVFIKVSWGLSLGYFSLKSSLVIFLFTTPL